MWASSTTDSRENTVASISMSYLYSNVGVFPCCSISVAQDSDFPVLQMMVTQAILGIRWV